MSAGVQMQVPRASQASLQVIILRVITGAWRGEWGVVLTGAEV